MAKDGQEVSNSGALIWGLAELLRGDYKQAEYGRVILPLVVLRRLDQDRVGEGKRRSTGIPLAEVAAAETAEQVAARLRSHIAGGSPTLREVMERFDFDRQIDRLAEAGLLAIAVERIVAVDLGPDRLSNLEMGYLFEELIRRFAEQSNETAGEHFTPREVIRLMVALLVDGDRDAGAIAGPVSVYDCACGSGGMLSEAQAHLEGVADVKLYGQELNQESYAICLADLLVKGQDPGNIQLGNTLAEDLHAGKRFDYCIANPPFGVDWAKVERQVRAEHAEGPDGRFGPGLPRKSDGQLLFLLHLVSKLRPASQGGGRIAIVHNSSPLFSGGAGTGESNIRRHVIENDLLEAVVALPEQLFYNTGIASFVWLLTNHKAPARRGKVQLIDGRDLFRKMPRSLGEKRREMTAEHIGEVLSQHRRFVPGPRSQILDNDELGYRAVTVERPLRAWWEIGPGTWAGLDGEKALRSLGEQERRALAAELNGLGERRFADEAAATVAVGEAVGRALTGVPPGLPRALVARLLVRDPEAPIQLGPGGRPTPDASLREVFQVPLSEPVEEYLAREVTPFAPDAWCQDPGGKVGYEIPFTRLFFELGEVRGSAEVLAELQEIEGEIRQLSREVLR